MQPYPDGQLRHKTVDPRPPPSTYVIFVTGSLTEVVGFTCQRFAEDFKYYYYLSVPDYLQHLLDSERESYDREALVLLHPKILKQMLERKDTIPSIFMIPILRYKIDQEVINGQRRFPISGLDQSMQTIMDFAAKASKAHMIQSIGVLTVHRSQSHQPCSHSSRQTGRSPMSEQR